MSAVGDGIVWGFRTGAHRLAAGEQRAVEDPSSTVVLIFIGVMGGFPVLAE